MKKISALILAAILACSSAFTQAPNSDSDSASLSKNHAVVASIIVNSDTIFQTTVDTTSTSTAVTFSSLKSSKAPKIKKQDGELVLSYEGNDFVLGDLVDEDVLSGHLSSLEDLDFKQQESDNDDLNFVALIFAIVFGFPCLTIIVGLFVILSYVNKRNRSRNELINNAIERNYQLPDSFYLGQKNLSGAPATPVRDSRKFYSATALIAVGLSLIIFAILVDGEFFVLVGGIPLLMGIGQMVGYYCVPTTPINPSHRPYTGPQMNVSYQMPSDRPQELENQPMPNSAPHSNQNGDQQTPPPYNPS